MHKTPIAPCNWPEHRCHLWNIRNIRRITEVLAKDEKQKTRSLQKKWRLTWAHLIIHIQECHVRAKNEDQVGKDYFCCKAKSALVVLNAQSHFKAACNFLDVIPESLRFKRPIQLTLARFNDACDSFSFRLLLLPPCRLFDGNLRCLFICIPLSLTSREHIAEFNLKRSARTFWNFLICWHTLKCGQEYVKSSSWFGQ